LNGTLGVYSAVDFGPGSDAAAAFAAQKEFNPAGMSPPMCTEFYTGWLTHWGESMANTSSAEVATWLDKLLSIGGSVSLYMVRRLTRSFAST
jgi:beta-galactosidase